MNNIRFVDIMHPKYTDPNYKMLLALRSPIVDALHNAKEYHDTHNECRWRMMHESYEQLKGAVHTLRTLDYISIEDNFRIPTVVYRTILHIACKQ